jgi:hypothetical protein
MPVAVHIPHEVAWAEAAIYPPTAHLYPLSEYEMKPL